MLTVVVALVLLGGVRRIAKVSETVVPFMVILYVLVCIVVLFANVTAIPSAVADIVVGAFNARAVTGGAVGSFFVAMQMGIARGIFSNEAGLGSAPIAAAAAKTKEPVRQGLVSMTGTFLDTIVVCTMTGLAIVITGSWNIGLDGVDVTIAAFSEGLPGVLGAAGPVLLMVCLIFFAFTTILGWNFYGERCLEYVVGRRKAAIYAYRVAYILAVFVGPYMTVAAVWDIADIFNGLMAIPNLIALVLFAVLTLIPQLYMARNQTGQQATTMRTTALVMAVMMLFIGWGLPAGVLLYYDVSTLWQVVQQVFVTQRVIEKAKADEEARLANAPIEVDVVRRERKQRPHKKN